MFTPVSLAMLAAVGLLAYVAKPVSTTADAVNAGYSSSVVVVDRDGYFVVTLGRVVVIVDRDSVSG